MGSINKQISRYEFTAVYSHPEAKVDIVLVHGLNGEPQRSWTAKNGVYWPTDLLPQSLRNAHANVLVYGYNADVYAKRHDRRPSDNFIHQHAQTLVTLLTHYRKSEESTRHPIIWVAHSLGGILAKRALLYSNDVRAQHHEDDRSIFVSTYGIIFLGTPHTGSDAATWGHVLQSMSDAVVPRKFFDTEPVLLKTLKRDSETLQNINSHFLDIYQRFHIHMAHENHKTDIKGTRLLVVDASSASPQLPGVTYYGIEATHSGMCKFNGPNAPGYRTVSTAIREWVVDAPQVIHVRWKVEEDDRLLRASLENYERIRSYERGTASNAESGAIVARNDENVAPQATTPEIAAPPPLPLLPEPPASESSELLDLQVVSRAEPIFVHPEQFRPNSFFVGREEEMRTLHRMLMDRKRRSEGTSAVLLQCLPGGGKTHLARQYVFQHRDDYSGGVYWIRAKSEQEMEYWYWRIAKNEALRGLLEHENGEDLRDPKKVVEMVRKWLASQENWLVVLDGIHFDMPGIEDFIPDAKNTSLIYTSTERSVIGDYRFDNPQVMELGLLSPQQAQELLLLEMDKRQPWTQDDRSRALELVQLMGRLPLMIHVAARQLKTTREPLSKYLRSYRNRPKVGDLPAYKAVREQLEHRGANAALNLISILSFFDQHIPVEMVALGLSALDNITPVKTSDASHTRATLSNTLKVLIAFALVERTDTDDMSAASSRSSTKNSVDKNATYIDLLKIHSVVQAFFIDTSVEERLVHFWLERAVATWCRSYDEANRRIREDGRLGLPDDYRRFAIHGKKLVENLKRFEKKSPELLLWARQNVEIRLDRIREEIAQLSQTVQSQIIDGSGEIPPTSVFERSSNSSESESAATISSHNSMTSWAPVLGDPGPSEEQAESPSLHASPDQPNPYHWHIPYPHQQSLMPTSPDLDNEDSRTVVAGDDGESHRKIRALEEYPSGIGQQHGGSLAAQTGVYDRQQRSPVHRSVRKNELRRYHDRAGSWRDQTVSDPRVSISRELARGSITSNKGTLSNPSHTSVAEAHLNKIRHSAPPSSDNEGLLREPSQRLITDALPPPLSILFKNSYTDGLAMQAVEEACSPEFSKSLAKIVSAPSTWTTATLKLLQENLKPTSPPAAEPHMLAVVDTPGSQHDRLDDHDTPLAPSPIFRGSRTANSSPGNPSSPFVTPPLPMETNLLPTMRHWDTAVFHPSLSRLESSGLAYDQDPLSLSTPSVLSRSAYPIPAQAPAARGWLATPTGYTSQPMSRDASRQSSNHAASYRLTAVAGVSRSFGSPGSPGTPGVSVNQQPHSPPLTGSGHGEPTAIRNSGLPIPYRSRQPSYTETEPSPRIDTGFPDVDTSYARWEENHHVQVGHGRAGSASDWITSGTPSGTPLAHSEQSLPRPGLWRFLRGGVRGRGRGGSGRSQSHSPSRHRQRLRSPSSPPVSSQIPPRPFSETYVPESAPVSEAQPMICPGSSGDLGAGAGEATGRSSSAGIALGDGRIIEFGTPPPQQVGPSTMPRPGRRLSWGSVSPSSREAAGQADVGLGIRH